MSADVSADAVLHRLAGASYPAIAMLHGIHPASARRYCRRAMKLGYVTAAQIAHQFKPKPKRIPDEKYAAHWIAAVKKRCKIDSNGCWLWTGYKSEKGYGQRSWRCRQMSVHRGMYIAVHGVKLTTEQVVCHTCDVRNCCNPDHLWLGTAADNVLDSAKKKRHRNARKTHCKRGHPLTGDNLWICSQGLRHCKACARARERLRNGWPQDMAYSIQAVPHGHRPVGAKWQRKAA